MLFRSQSFYKYNESSYHCSGQHFPFPPREQKRSRAVPAAAANQPFCLPDIRGKLVPQDPNDEPASVLLERISAEKEELIKQGKIKRDKKESVIFKGDDNSYYLRTGRVEESLEDWRFDDLPETWKICCLGELCDYGDCINVNTEDIAEDAWILDLEDIEKDTGTVLKKVTKDQRNSVSTKHKFHSGQVLYSKLRPYLNKVVLSDADGYCTSEILCCVINGADACNPCTLVCGSCLFRCSHVQIIVGNTT